MIIVRLVFVIVLTLTGAYIHGQQTFRWGLSHEFDDNSKIVKAFPVELGNWKQVDEASSLSENVIQELGLTEYVSRSYQSTEGSVGFLLMTGKAGRLIRHTPDICYGAAGNEFLTEPKLAKFDVDGVKHEFGVLPIRQQSLGTSEFVVVYGFARDGVFSNPSNPRIEFHGTQSILKFQLLCRPSGERPGEVPEYAKSFLTDACRYVSSASAGK
ncbi:MAG: exosortase-associated EpsI family protein [Planctomyces sp.]|nr:exosortase-associated EpsI family protein [Planctomyces sp.]